MPDPTVRVLASAKETGQALSRDLEGARSVSVAVAFAKPSAWEAVDLRAWCARERSLRLVVGTDFAITDLDVLRDLGARPSAHCKVMHRAATANVSFHPKLYLVEREDSVVAYVGSSNLTLGGLRTNIEANVRIEGRPDAEARGAFEGYFGHELATELSPEFAARYDELRALRPPAKSRSTAWIRCSPKRRVRHAFGRRHCSLTAHAERSDAKRSMGAQGASLNAMGGTPRVLGAEPSAAMSPRVGG